MPSNTAKACLGLFIDPGNYQTTIHPTKFGPGTLFKVHILSSCCEQFAVRFNYYNISTELQFVSLRNDAENASLS